MKKSLVVSVGCLIALLLVGAVGSGLATAGDTWTENFNSFVPQFVGADFVSWFEAQNSTNEANVTFTHGCPDGKLSLTSNTLLVSSAMCLRYTRKILIEDSIIVSMRWAVHDAFCSSLVLLYDATLTHKLFEFNIGATNTYFKYLAYNDSFTNPAYFAHTDDVWYTATITWTSVPCSYNVLILEDGDEVPKMNVTFADPKYDLVSADYVLIDLGANTAVSFSRFYVDYVRIGDVFSTYGVNFTSLMGTMMSLAVISMLVAMFKKFGGGRQ